MLIFIMLVPLMLIFPMSCLNFVVMSLRFLMSYNGKNLLKHCNLQVWTFIRSQNFFDHANLEIQVFIFLNFLMAACLPVNLFFVCSFLNFIFRLNWFCFLSFLLDTRWRSDFRFALHFHWWLRLRLSLNFWRLRFDFHWTFAWNVCIYLFTWKLVFW